MTSHIYLLLGKSPGAASVKSISKAILLNQGFWVRGDSVEIPGAIDVLSVGHHVGYFQTEDHQHLLNRNDGSGDIDLDAHGLDAAPSYGARNKWDDIMHRAAYEDPTFAPNAANSRMYRRARGIRADLTAQLQRERDAPQGPLNESRALSRRAALRRNALNQTIQQARVNWDNRPLGDDEESARERGRLARVRDQALNDLHDAVNVGGEIHTLLQQSAAARQQFLNLRAQYRRTRGQHNQRMNAALREFNYRDYFTKKVLERQGMLMGTPNTLPIHGNFFFKKRTDVSTPRLALGCSQQTDYTYALFLFIRRIGPGLGGIRNPFLVIGLAGIKVVHWEMEGIDEENVALSYRNIAYGSLDSIADTNLPFVPSTRWFDRQNFHGSEGGWAATMMLAVQALFTAYGLAAKAAGGDW